MQALTNVFTLIFLSIYCVCICIHVGPVFPVGLPAPDVWIGRPLCGAWCKDLGLWSAEWRLSDRLLAGSHQTLKGGTQKQCH